MKKTYLNFEQLKEYIENREIKSLNISQLKQDDAAYFNLFLLIDQSLEYTKGKIQIDPGQNISYQSLEQILLELLSGKINKHNSRRFLELLYSHPDYYNRILNTFDTEPTAQLPLEEIQIKENTFFISEIKKSLTQSATLKPFAEKILNTVSVKIKNITTPQYIPRLAILSIAVIMISLFTVKTILYQQSIDHQVYNKYFRTASLPYDYYDKTQRSSIASFDTNQEYLKISNLFKLAMVDYMQKNYKEALKNLYLIKNNLETNSAFLNNPDLKSRDLLRDIYFYTGISELALAGKSKGNKHLQSASLQLNKAKEMVLEHNLKGGDREFFFLGLALDLRGNDSRSFEYLGSIEKNSPFFKDSQEIIKQRTNP